MNRNRNNPVVNRNHNNPILHIHTTTHIHDRVISMTEHFPQNRPNFKIVEKNIEYKNSSKVIEILEKWMGNRIIFRRKTVIERANQH